MKWLLSDPSPMPCRRPEEGLSPSRPSLTALALMLLVGVVAAEAVFAPAFAVVWWLGP